MVFIVHVKNVVRVEMERDRKPKPLENAIFYRGILSTAVLVGI